MSDALSQSPDFALPAWIQRGDVARWWDQGQHKFAFDPVPGRYIILCFYRTGGDPTGQAALQTLRSSRHFVDDGKASFFGIVNEQAAGDRRDLEASGDVVRFLWDPEKAVNRAYGIGDNRMWIILNPMLRVVDVFAFSSDASDRERLVRMLTDLPPPGRFLGFEIPAPVLILSNVFESELCQHLIECFERQGGRESGFMQEIDGKVREMFDENWKRRRDYLITDPELVRNIRTRIGRRVIPEIWKAFAFKASRIERDLLACYRSEEEGHFGPHRDNTVKGTEHRRFAVSINLNDDFEGGTLSFPEYCPRSIKAPIGAAVVFSGAILHEVARVTRGRRYAFLPFLFDEEAERIRQSTHKDLSVSA